MITAETTIINKLGLHARAATKFANVAAQYECQIQVSCHGKTIDGKSIMSLMLLAAAKGTEITLTAEGQDQEEALQSLLNLIADKFGEEA